MLLGPYKQQIAKFSMNNVAFLSLPTLLSELRTVCVLFIDNYLKLTSGIL
jgi:hypothetical protein